MKATDELWENNPDNKSKRWYALCWEFSAKVNQLDAKGTNSDDPMVEVEELVKPHVLDLSHDEAKKLFHESWEKINNKY